MKNNNNNLVNGTIPATLQEAEKKQFLDLGNSNIQIIPDVIPEGEIKKRLSECDELVVVSLIPDAVILSPLAAPDVSKKKKGWRQFIGIGCAIVSSLCFSLVMLLVKLLDNYHPLSLAVHRHWGNLIPSIPIVIYYRYWKKVSVFDELWPLSNSKNLSNAVGLCVRGTLGATAVMLRFYSLEYLTIADATVVMYSGPLIIIVLAHYCLKEELSIVAIITGLVMLMGVVLIARPPFLTNSEFDMKNFIGICIVMGIVFCQAFVTILVRKIRKLHFAVMQLVFGAWGLAQCWIIAKSFGVMSYPEGIRDICLTVLLAVVSFLGQLLNILAIKFEDAGVIGLVKVVDVLFSFLWTILFLYDVPDIYSVLGGCIISIGVVFIGFRKVIGTLAEDNKTRTRFRFILF